MVQYFEGDTSKLQPLPDNTPDNGSANAAPAPSVNPGPLGLAPEKQTPAMAALYGFTSGFGGGIPDVLARVGGILSDGTGTDKYPGQGGVENYRQNADALKQHNPIPYYGAEAAGNISSDVLGLPYKIIAGGTRGFMDTEDPLHHPMEALANTAVGAGLNMVPAAIKDSTAVIGHLPFLQGLLGHGLNVMVGKPAALATNAAAPYLTHAASRGDAISNAMGKPVMDGNGNTIGVELPLPR